MGDQELVQVKRATHFFDLPQELRDEIYKQYSNPMSRSTGALEGFFELPSPAPLVACKQVREEMSPIFFKGLENVLVQRRVCIKLDEPKSRDETCFMGWSLWYHGLGLTNWSFDIWVRDGREEEDFAAWGVDKMTLLSLKNNLTTPSCSVAGKRFARFRDVLDKIHVQTVTCSPRAVNLRLKALIDKIDGVIREVKLREEADKATTRLELDAQYTSMDYHAAANLELSGYYCPMW